MVQAESLYQFVCRAHGRKKTRSGAVWLHYTRPSSYLRYLFILRGALLCMKFALGVADGSTLRIVNTLDQAITSILTEGGKQLLPTGKRIEPGSEEVFPLSVSALPLRIFCGQSEACIYIAHQHEYTNTKQR